MISLNIAEVVSLVLKIEDEIGIKCSNRGLYDKVNKEFITIKNHRNNDDYNNTYRDMCNYRYAYHNSLTDNVVSYLFKHHGEIYFPMLKKGTQKAYVARFDINELLKAYGEKYLTVQQNSYHKSKKKRSTQCEGQLVLQF